MVVVEVDGDGDGAGAETSRVTGAGVVLGVGVCGVVFELVEAAFEVEERGEGETPLWEGDGLRGWLVMVVMVGAGVVWIPVAVVVGGCRAWGGGARDGGQPGVG